MAEFVDELLLISLPVLGITSFLSTFDMSLDFLQGYVLYHNEKLYKYGILTFCINWIPGVIASIHLISNQGKILGPKKTFIWCCK